VRYAPDVATAINSSELSPQAAAAAAAQHVVAGLVARASASVSAGLGGNAPGMAAALAGQGSANFVRNSLGGNDANNPPPPPGISLADAQASGGPSMQTQQRVDQTFVDRNAPRNQNAINMMQQMHDQFGGPAANVDVRTLNGMNDSSMQPRDRQNKPLKPRDQDGPYGAGAQGRVKGVAVERDGDGDVMATASSNQQPPPAPPGAGAVKMMQQPHSFPTNAPQAQAILQARKAPLVGVSLRPRSRSPVREAAHWRAARRS